jgi:hypothetical protein
MSHTSHIDLQVSIGNGHSVTVTVMTAYPFGDTATVVVSPPAAASTIQLRLPSWATAATVALNDNPPGPVGDYNGTFFALPLPAGQPTKITVNFNPSMCVVLLIICCYHCSSPQAPQPGGSVVQRLHRRIAGRSSVRPPDWREPDSGQPTPLQ